MSSPQVIVANRSKYFLATLASNAASVNYRENAIIATHAMLTVSSVSGVSGVSEFHTSLSRCGSLYQVYQVYQVYHLFHTSLSRGDSLFQVCTSAGLRERTCL